MSGGRRGRPQKAAQTLDEALARHYAGVSPPRARNDFERQAMSTGRGGKRGGGRQVNPQSSTRVAAELAVYLVKDEGLSLRAAAARAAATYKVNADNVRRYAARIARGPMVDVPVRVAPHLRQLVGGGDSTVPLPFLASVEDAPQS